MKDPFSFFNDSTLVFLHIPKCGGTTLDRAAKEIFGRRNHRYFRASRLPTQDFSSIPKKKVSNIYWLSGHFGIGADFLSSIEKQKSYISNVRHPLDRIKSYYSYQLKKSKLDESAHRSFISTVEFDEFVDHIIRKDHFLSHNDQCNILFNEPVFSQNSCENNFLLLSTHSSVDRAAAMINDVFAGGAAALDQHRNKSPRNQLEFVPRQLQVLNDRLSEDVRLYEWVQQNELKNFAKALDRLTS